MIRFLRGRRCVVKWLNGDWEEVAFGNFQVLLTQLIIFLPRRLHLVNIFHFIPYIFFTRSIKKAL